MRDSCLMFTSNPLFNRNHMSISIIIAYQISRGVSIGNCSFHIGLDIWQLTNCPLNVIAALNCAWPDRRGVQAGLFLPSRKLVCSFNHASSGSGNGVSSGNVVPSCPFGSSLVEHVPVWAPQEIPAGHLDWLLSVEATTADKHILAFDIWFNCWPSIFPTWMRT